MNARSAVKIIGLSAVGLLAAGLITAAVLIDRAATAPELKPRIESAASAFLGRPLTIDSLEWRRWPSAQLVARGVRLYEDPLKARVLIEAPSVEAQVALLSLMTLSAGVTELKLIEPHLTLRRGKDGLWNVAQLVDDIAARPDEPVRKWGRLVFNWFSAERGVLSVEDSGGSLRGFPALEFDGRGKLKLGASGAHFPFNVNGRVRRSSASFEVSGDAGAEDRLRVRLENLALSTSTPLIERADLTIARPEPAEWTLEAAARSGGTDLSAAATFRTRETSLEVRSRKADLGVLAAWGRAASALIPADARPRKGVPRASPPRLAVRLKADELIFGTVELRGVSAEVSRGTGPYTLDRASFQSLDGSITARGSYLPTAPADGLRFSWKTSGVRAADLFLLAGSSLAANGTVDSEGSLITGLGDRFLPGMNGEIKLDVKNGWLEDMPALLKVLERLNVTTLLTRITGRRRPRMAFDEARGSIKIAAGRASTVEPFVLENKTMQMAFMGSYDLPTKTVDGRVAVNFLMVTDEVIRMIPVVNYILLGNEKSLTPIWLKVKGKADNPDVDLLPMKSIAAPIWNSLGRLLRLPEKLVQKLKSK
jgi:hypothetical protein